jgi:hypothetical protein
MSGPVTTEEAREALKQSWKKVFSGAPVRSSAMRLAGVTALVMIVYRIYICHISIYHNKTFFSRFVC